MYNRHIILLYIIIQGPYCSPCNVEMLHICISNIYFFTSNRFLTKIKIKSSCKIMTFTCKSKMWIIYYFLYTVFVHVTVKWMHSKSWLVINDWFIDHRSKLSGWCIHKVYLGLFGWIALVRNILHLRRFLCRSIAFLLICTTFMSCFVIATVLRLRFEFFLFDLL